MKKASLEEMVKTTKRGVARTYPKRYEMAVVLPDMHVPFHDEQALAPVIRFIQDYKPQKIIQAGDMYDFYELSKFDKDPKREKHLQDEIDEGKQIWRRLKYASPRSELILIEGNHERRLHKYLMRNPELHSLTSLRLENVLEVKSLGVKVVLAEDDYFLNENLLVTHGASDDGCKLSTKSGYTANANLLKKGVSGLQGHSHRLGASFKSDYKGQKVWYELGCLCKLNPEYSKNPDWQQGFAVVHYGKHYFNVQLIPITEKYNFYYGGKLYRGSLQKTKKG